jgi:hypothetical protein
VDRRLVCNPGALLRDAPAPVLKGGSFGVLELPEMRFTVL